MSNHTFHNGQQTHHAQGDFLGLLQSEGGGARPGCETLNLNPQRWRASISWARRDSLCSHCTFVTVASHWNWWYHYQHADRLRLCLPVSGRGGNRDIPAANTKLSVTGVSPLAVPACCHIVQDCLCVCVCMHWKHCSYCLLMSFFCLPPLDTIPNNAERSKGYYHSSHVFYGKCAVVLSEIPVQTLSSLLSSQLFGHLSHFLHDVYLVLLEDYWVQTSRPFKSSKNTFVNSTLFVFLLW